METYKVKNGEFLQSLFEHNPDGVFSLNSQGFFTSVNKRACELSGYSSEELLQMHFSELAAEDELEKLNVIFQQALLGIPNYFNTKIIKKNGEILHILLKDIPIKLQNKITGIYGIAKDISQQKQLEDELWETKEKLDSIINSSADSIVVYDTQDRILKVNKAFETLYGWTEEDVIGRRACYDDLNLKSKIEAITTLVKEGQHITDIELQRQKKDGSLLSVSVTFSPIRNTSGDIIAYSAISRDISERKKAEAELKESRELYKLITDNAFDLISVVNTDGKLIYLSPSHKKVLGYNFKDSEEVKVETYFHPDDIEILRKKIAFSLDSKQSFSLEVRVKHIDGRWIDFESIGTPVLNDGGEVKSLVIVSRDITLRKRAENLLMESEVRYRLIAENTSDLISIIHMDGTLSYASPSHIAILGYQPEAFSKILENGLLHPDDLQQIIDSVRLLRVNKEPITIEYKIKHKSGHWVDLETNISPIINKDNEISSIVCVSRDITERKVAERQLKQSEEKYRLIAENTMDLIAIIDLTGKIIYASPSHERILGTKTTDMIGQCSLSFLHQDDQAKLISWIDLMNRNKSAQQLELRIKHMDGYYLTFEAHGMPVLDEEGKINSIVIVSRDITDRKKTDALLRRSDKLSVLGELAAGIAHEIRNPLTSLKGFTQILKSSVPEGEHYFNIMLSELDRINDIVSEFMLLAKPQVMDFKQQNIIDIINKVISLLEAQANLHNIQILVYPIKWQPFINCVEDQLKQVFINILKNAIEAMPEGGTIFINMAAENDMLTISFIDQGIGIPEDRLKSIGEPFYTTKEKGNGLGMMICHKIIENHFGSIHIKSKVNVGTTVEVNLPIS